ncbi:hypothetical protein KIK84_04750 [Curvibacter sp. CHRR-16]|uniref:hypothetical protein n=1 Tax=Curvibacter sp. CHRR-16 TaxID=2835872 RepID=UPI001BD91DB8|nr:hypothetical protein [Curvibacter sp. CHRR-16]MBT0569622.1 hypothetical protein [Curvibacter sp. CHRR-16]
MTIIIAGKIIHKSGDLSMLARQTLAFVDGGLQWLDWALNNPTVCYDLPDETLLVGEVQQGLHACPMALLPTLGLWISPIKLMALGSPNLRTLAQAESGDTSTPILEQTQRILSDNQIITAAQLARANALLQDLGVAGSAVFQGMNFLDRLALFDLAALPDGQLGQNPQQLRRDAAQFAVHQARTVQQFCDYYQVYLAQVAKLHALDATTEERNSIATQAMQTLLPLAFGALDCPQLPHRLASPDDVQRCLHNWLGMGRKLGFASVSEAVLQVVTQTIFSTETGTQASQLFDQYLRSAQAFLSNNNLRQSRLGQDGASLSFTLQNRDQQAVLHVSAQYLLSLGSFGAFPPPTPSEGLPPNMS